MAAFPPDLGVEMVYNPLNVGQTRDGLHHASDTSLHIVKLVPPVQMQPWPMHKIKEYLCISLKHLGRQNMWMEHGCRNTQYTATISISVGSPMVWCQVRSSIVRQSLHTDVRPAQNHLHRAKLRSHKLCQQHFIQNAQ